MSYPITYYIHCLDSLTETEFAGSYSTICGETRAEFVAKRDGCRERGQYSRWPVAFLAGEFLSQCANPSVGDDDEGADYLVCKICLNHKKVPMLLLGGLE